MEVFPFQGNPARSKGDFLHVHGGVSKDRNGQRGDWPFSPCAWRCFQPRLAASYGKSIFSMCMEVFLSALGWAEVPLNFLHGHGGVSQQRAIDRRPWAFSPSVWRCFRGGLLGWLSSRIFSMCMEVFSCCTTFWPRKVDPLHMYGDVCLKRWVGYIWFG